MAGLLTLLLGACALLLALPVLVLLAQVLAARRRDPGAGVSATGERPPLAVLVPAHDEAVGLPPTLQDVQAQLRPGDRLLVVADNCRDATAAVAAGCGAEVAVRTDPARRGKGYALDFGLALLSERPPALVVVVDADCRLAPGALDRLARACAASGRPAQARYRMELPHSPAGQPAPLRARLAAFAWTVRNEVRPLGALRMGWPCQLMGSGMCFPWALLRAAPLASGHLVEDLQLGIDLARAGAAPRYCPEAVVRSRFPADGAAQRAQRTRWEHGHLGVLLAQGPRLLAEGLAAQDRERVALALDLMVPPLAALVALLGAVLLASLAKLALGGGGLPALVAAAALLALAAAIGLAWSRFGRALLSGRELLGVPAYVLAKLPLYGRWLRRRETAWVRTARDEQPR